MEILKYRYNRIISPLLLFLFVNLATALSVSAQISLNSTISPPSGTTEDYFKFVVTVVGAQSAPQPVIRGGDDFTLSFIGPQTSLSVVNGSVDMRTSYVYKLAPKRTGELQAPVAEIETTQGKIVTDPITISVSDEPNRTTGEDSGEQEGASSSGSNANVAKNFFLDQNLTPNEKVYVGQQLVNTVSLYTRLQAQDIRLSDLTVDGFWQETLSDDQRSAVQIKGLDFSSIQILKALYPLRSGRLIVPSRIVMAKVPKIVQRPSMGNFDPFSDDIFENFFGVTEFTDVQAEAKAIEVEVLPLPDPGDTFAPLLTMSPLVGETKIKIDYALDVLKVGESKSVTVEVASEGNLNPIKKLDFKAPDGVKVYEERAEVGYDRTGPRLKTIKRFRYALVPLKAGYFTVPGISLAYFDPRSESYKTIKSNDIAFVVQGGSAESAPTVSESPMTSGLGSKADDKKLGAKDGVMLEQQLEQDGPLKYEDPTVLDQLKERISIESLLLLFAVVIGIAVVAFVAIQVRVPSDAPHVLQQKIQSASTLKEVQPLFHEYLLVKLKAPKQGKGASTVTVDQIRSLLSSSGQDSEIVNSAKSLLDDIERLLYSAQQDSGADVLTPIRSQIELLTKAWR